MSRRSQFFITALILFFTYALSYFSIFIIKEGEIAFLEPVAFAWFGGNAVFTLIAYPFIYFIEKIFGFVSDVTLMELSDTNNQLLRKMSEQAPGTFQHSLQVANLAEAATRELKGDTLLIRTGALYHDIGKMKNPAFFIENQKGNNPHDKLDYDESAKIIISHVKNGVEMAKKNGLPPQIIEFIKTHHGTTTTEYFYRMQKQKYPDQEVKIKDYQYPGPKPFSKETAVLMMADSVEAASKSLKEYDAETISNLVESIINHQVEKQQFENSDITFKDISLIKNIFKQKLMNIYHVRIAYPDKD